MNNALFDKCEEAVTNLSEHVDSLFFWPLITFFDVFAKIAVTDFLYDVIVFGALHDIIEHNYIFGVQFL